MQLHFNQNQKTIYRNSIYSDRSQKHNDKIIFYMKYMKFKKVFTLTKFFKYRLEFLKKVSFKKEKIVYNLA